MRTDWQSRKLSDVCQIKPPKKEAKELLSEDDLVSFVPMNDLGIRQKDLALKEEKPLGKVVGSYTYFADNDVLLAKITPCFENGKLGIARGLKNGVGFGSSEYIVFRSNGEIDPEYLFYYLSQNSFRDEGAKVMTGAVGHKRVPKEFIEDHPIPLPPIEEQIRIVSILDEAFAGIDTAIANTEKNLANARELFESYLNSVFTKDIEDWEKTTLGEAYDVRDGTHDSPKYQPEGRALVTSKNLKREGLNFEKIKYISEDDYINISRRSGVHKGDVLFAMIGTIGNPIVVEVEPDFAIKNVALFKVSNDRSGHYLKYYLGSRFVIDKMMSEAKGTTQKFVGLGYLRQFPIILPSLDVESDIVKSLTNFENEVNRLENIYQQKLNSLNELKQSLLQKAFFGELTTKADKLMDEAVA